jgi:hypothetical protein
LVARKGGLRLGAAAALVFPFFGAAVLLFCVADVLPASSTSVKSTRQRRFVVMVCSF